MANITCPQCKRFVDDTTKFCPGCKFNIKKYVKEMKKKGMSVGSSLSLNGIYAHNSEPAKFVPELDFLKGANSSSSLDFMKKEAAPAAAPSAAAPTATPELDFLKKQESAPAAPQAAAQPVQQPTPAANVDMFAPPIPQAPVNRTNVSAMSPADVFSEKPVAPRQVITPAPSAPVMSQAAAMAAYQEKREATQAAHQAAAYASAAAAAQAQQQQQIPSPAIPTQAAAPASPIAPPPATPQMSQAAAMAAYQQKRESVQQHSFTTPQTTQPLASSALNRPMGASPIAQQTIQPVFESASLNSGALNGGGALSGVLSGPTIMEKIAAEKRLAKENESIFESASLRKAEKEIKAGTRQAAGGLHGDIPLDAYRDNGVQRFGEASEYQRQMAALGQGAAGANPPYAAKQPPYAAQNPYGQAAPYATQQTGSAAPSGLNPMFAAPQSANPLFGGGAPQPAASPYGQTAPGAPNGLLAQPAPSANPLFGGAAPAGNPMLASQPAAPAGAAPAAYQPVQQEAAHAPYQPVQQQPAPTPTPYQPVQQPTAPVGYQPVQQAGAPAGVFTGAPSGGGIFGSQPAPAPTGSVLFGSQPAAPTGSAMFGQAPGQPAAPGQPVGVPYGG